MYFTPSNSPKTSIYIKSFSWSPRPKVLSSSFTHYSTLGDLFNTSSTISYNNSGEELITHLFKDYIFLISIASIFLLKQE